MLDFYFFLKMTFAHFLQRKSDIKSDIKVDNNEEMKMIKREEKLEKV